MSTIPLSKPYDEKKIEFPGFVSQKLDGVPVRIDMDFSGPVPAYAVQSRQAEPMPSVDAQVNHFVRMLLDTGVVKNGRHTFVAEVTHTTLRDFKDVSGVVRRKTQQEDLILNVFDYVNWQQPDLDFGERLTIAQYLFQHFSSEIVKLIPQFAVGVNEFQPVCDHLLDRFPNAEGLVYRAFKGKFEAGSRRWNYMKILNEPTIELRIVGFEEGKGKNANAVGRLIAEYKGGRIGVGPGKLSYKERRNLWDTYKELLDSNGLIVADVNLIAQIKYKKDDSYAALRQPTFQYWRPEKDTPDA